MTSKPGRIIQTHKTTPENLADSKKNLFGCEIDCGTIVDLMTGDEWKVRRSIKKRWKWRKTAFKLAVAMHLKQVMREEAGECNVRQIHGGNGDALVHLTLYVPVPKQYDAAKRQRAMMGLESAAAYQGKLTPAVMAKIATAAVTGHQIGWLRRGHIRYLCRDRYCDKSTTVAYDFAEDDAQTMWLHVQHAQHITAGQTYLDEQRDWNAALQRYNEPSGDDDQGGEDESSYNQFKHASPRLKRRERKAQNKEEHRRKREQERNPPLSPDVQGAGA